MESLWENTAARVEFPALEGDLTTDVLIIGGGMCGLLCAHRLQRAGVNSVLAEADVLCSGGQASGQPCHRRPGIENCPTLPGGAARL